MSSPCTVGNFVGVAVALVGVGCSSATGDSGAGVSGNAGTSLGEARPAIEGARVQAYLDSLYRPEHVRHSFTSRMGDLIDCVDFAQEPGVRELVAEGHSLESLLAPFEESRSAARTDGASAAKPPGDAYFDGLPDESGADRACPAQTVPHVRVTSAQIAAAGGVDAYRDARGRHAAPGGARSIQPDSNPAGGGVTNYDEDNYGHVYSDQQASGVSGGIATIAIASSADSPRMYNHGWNHSVGQIWISGGSGANHQTLEAGWKITVDRPDPYLFVGATQDNYADFCENGVLAKGTTCVKWVRSPWSSLALGATLPASTIGGAQHELTVSTHYVCYLGRPYFPCIWNVSASVDGAPSTTLGYFAVSGYNGGALALGQANEFEAGGEVHDMSSDFSEVTMGEASLYWGMASYGRTAYVHDFGYYSDFCIGNRIGGCSLNLVQTGATVYSTRSRFTYNTTSGAGSSAWSNWFYYGNFFSDIIIFPG